MNDCQECFGTGLDIDGNICKCVTETKDIEIPVMNDIPQAYSKVKFSSDLLPQYLNSKYILEMDNLFKEVANLKKLSKNYLICSPPNSGKTILSYNIYAYLRGNGVRVYKPLDIIEVMDLLTQRNYNGKNEEKDLFDESKVVFVKIPLDLPNKCFEKMYSILERKVRRGGNIIFLYASSYSNLIAQDTFGLLKSFVIDGSYNSLYPINGYNSSEDHKENKI